MKKFKLDHSGNLTLIREDEFPIGKSKLNQTITQVFNQEGAAIIYKDMKSQKESLEKNIEVSEAKLEEQKKQLKDLDETIADLEAECKDRMSLVIEEDEAKPEEPIEEPKEVSQ